MATSVSMAFTKARLKQARWLVFYIESNTHVQINVLDVAGQQIGFAEGTLTNGAFD